MPRIEPLTIRSAQLLQPWTRPYAENVLRAVERNVPHFLGTHVVLHVTKSCGKLAAVFEAMDHPVLNEPGVAPWGPSRVNDAGQATIRDMAADLMTAALRLANLYDFNLADELERRTKEKNGVGYPGGD